MSSLKKFDYRIKDNRKRNIFLCGIILVLITIVGIKLYQSKAEFTGTSSELNLASGKVRLTCTDKVKPNYNQELINYVNDLYESGECSELVNDETKDNNLRYIGANPDNYVWFNDELWRIIGVMNNIDDGTGKTETRIKLIRDESLGDFYWDYKQNGVGSSTTKDGSNDWSDSQLMMMLNSADIIEENWSKQETKKGYIIDSDGTAKDNNNHVIFKKVGSYYNKTNGYKPATAGTTSFIETEVDFSKTGLNEEYKNLIGQTKFYLGGANWTNYSSISSEYYKIERSDQVYNKNPKTWTGYIGLMYPSDYGYATSGGKTTDRKTCLAKPIYNWGKNENYTADEWTDCRNNDWLYDKLKNQLTIMPHQECAYGIVRFFTTGNLNFRYPIATEEAIRPVLYLKASVKIISGKGTEQNPFKIAL